MLIVQIAFGIVLAYLVIKFWAQLLAGALWLLVVMIAVATLVLLFNEGFQKWYDGTPFFLLVFFILAMVVAILAESETFARLRSSCKSLLASLTDRWRSLTVGQRRGIRLTVYALWFAPWAFGFFLALGEPPNSMAPYEHYAWPFMGLVTLLIPWLVMSDEPGKPH